MNQDLQSDWQELGRRIAHSLSGSLGMFGFSLSSELARQIEQLLGSPQELTIEQGQWLYSMVEALQSELERPVSLPDLYYFNPAAAIDILLVAVDPTLERDIQSLVDDRQWHMPVAPTIAAAKSQLHSQHTRSILLAPDIAKQAEEVVGLLVDVGKHVPIIPVILLTDAPTLPEINRFGTCTICPNHPSEMILEVERSIDRVESTLIHILATTAPMRASKFLRSPIVSVKSSDAPALAAMTTCVCGVSANSYLKSAGSNCQPVEVSV